MRRVLRQIAAARLGESSPRRTSGDLRLSSFWLGKQNSRLGGGRESFRHIGAERLGWSGLLWRFFRRYHVLRGDDSRWDRRAKVAPGNLAPGGRRYQAKRSPKDQTNHPGR